ncbi:uncharacterized protein A1O9_08144, partial [Exophiala aquamarina CBS 119918]
PGPRDEGVVLSPTTKPLAPRKAATFGDKDWIFDTGATSHVCSNRTLLHRYSSLNPYTNRSHAQAVAHFGPNPIPIVGIGDATLSLPAGDASSSVWSKLYGPSDQNLLGRQPLTIRNVRYIPDGGVNLISWSQLKQSKNVNLYLAEENDGVLVVWARGHPQPLMRFALRDGLYFLEQAPAGVEFHASQAVRTPGDN